MKKIKDLIKREFLKFGIILLSFSIIVVTIILIKIDFELKTLLLLIILSILLFILLPIRRKIAFYSERMNYFKLVENQEKPFDIKFNPFNINFFNYLKDEKNFSENSLNSHKDLHVFYKVLNKKDSKLAKNGMLQIIILIDNININYNSSLIEREINFIENNLENIKFNQYSIMIIKNSNNLSKDTIKKTVPHTRFEKHGVTHLISIPIIYSNNKIFFLHNRKFSPNRYYTYTVDSIYQILNLD